MNFKVQKIFLFLCLGSFFFHSFSRAEENIQHLHKTKLKEEEVKKLFETLRLADPETKEEGVPIYSLSYKVKFKKEEFIFLPTDNIPAPSPSEHQQCGIHVLNSEGAELELETLPCDQIVSLYFFKYTPDSSEWFSVCIKSKNLKNHELNYCSAFKKHKNGTGVFNVDDKLNDYLINNKVTNMTQFKKYFGLYFKS